MRRPLQTLLLLALLFRALLEGGRNAIIVHCYYNRAELRDRLPIVATSAVVMYQAVMLRFLGTLGTLVVLDASVERALREAAISASTIELGVYEASGKRSRRDAIRREWHVSEDELVIGLVGHPMAFKRYADFINLFSRMESDARIGVRIVYVGGNRDRDKNEWHDIVTGLNALTYDTWSVTGELDDVKFIESICALDLCVMPYRELAQASAVLASIAGNGTPCLVSDARLFDGVVEAGGAIRIGNLDECSPAYLASTIRSLNLPFMRVRMLDYASAHSLRRTAEHFIRLFETSSV